MSDSTCTAVKKESRMREGAIGKGDEDWGGWRMYVRYVLDFVTSPVLE